MQQAQVEAEQKLKEEVEKAENRVRERVRNEVCKQLEGLMQTQFKGMQFKPSSPTAEIKQLLIDYTAQISQISKEPKLDTENIKNMQSSWDKLNERF
jgi:hypothetical protein